MTSSANMIQIKFVKLRLISMFGHFILKCPFWLLPFLSKFIVIGSQKILSEIWWDHLRSLQGVLVCHGHVMHRALTFRSVCTMERRSFCFLHNFPILMSWWTMQVQCRGISKNKPYYYFFLNLFIYSYSFYFLKKKKIISSL